MEVRRVFEDGATNTRRVSTWFEETKTSSPIMDSWVSGEEVRITTHADLRRIQHQTTRRAEVRGRSNHGSVAEKSSTCAEGIGDEIKRDDLACLEIP